MKKGSPIFYGTLLLTAANLLLQLVAMSFRVYLSGRIGAAGTGLLQLIFAVRDLSFTMGAAGIRTCAMYLSAEELGRGRPQRIGAVLSGCFHYALVCSAVVGGCMWYFAPWLSEVWIADPAVAPSLRLYALFLPLRCLQGVMTGYFTAAGRIGSLVKVGFCEQLCSIGLTFFLLDRWGGEDAGRACLCVAAGSCAATLFALVILLLLYRLCRREAGERTALCPPYGRILKVAAPIALADDLRSGLNAFENLLVPQRLALFAGTVNALADYGIVCGMVFPVLMFPSVILYSLADLLVPEFSRCAAGRSGRRVRYLAKQSLRVSLLFGLCAAGVLFAGADALGELLYESAEAGAYLRLYAPLVPLLYMDAVVDAICKGMGQQSANARYNVLTSFLDVTFLWVLLPRLGLGGYYFSFAITHLINFCLSLRRLIKVTEIRLELGMPLRAAVCAIGAGLMTRLLPEYEGVMGAVFPAACYLLLLVLAWMVCCVVSWEDFRWLRGLVAGRREGRAASP